GVQALYGSKASAQPAQMSSPADGSVLSAMTTTFSWTAGSGITSFFLLVGHAAGGSDVYQGPATGNHSQTVATPSDGRKLYVTLGSWVNGSWVTNAYTYTDHTAKWYNQSITSNLNATAGSRTGAADGSRWNYYYKGTDNQLWCLYWNGTQ